MILFPSFNLPLFAGIHHFVGVWPLLDSVMIFCAAYVPYVIVGGLLLWCLPVKRQSIHRTTVGVSLVAALIARFIVKPSILLFYAEPRPLMYFSFHPLISTPVRENLQAFPSGHALFFFGLATTVFLFDKKVGTVVLLAALLNGIARIYTGVHWPLDIALGALLGGLVGIGTFYLYKKRR